MLRRDSRPERAADHTGAAARAPFPALSRFRWPARSGRLCLWPLGHAPQQRTGGGQFPGPATLAWAKLPARKVGMAVRARLVASVIVLLLAAPSSARAQVASAEDLATKLANPISSLISV